MTTKKTFAFITLLLLCHWSRAGEQPALADRIAASLQSYLADFPKEKVTVQTDKDLYVPSDIIWFHAWITSRAGSKIMNLSPELIVSLYNAAGIFITGDKFQISEGKVSGDLRLPEILTSGRYYLVAHTPLQLSTEEIFIKPVLVDQPYEQDARVMPEDAGRIYPPGTEVQVNLAVFTTAGQPADRYTFDYQVTHAGVTLVSGKTRSAGGKASVFFRTPDDTGGEPVKLVLSHTRNLWNQAFYLRTGSDKISIRFYPEGGHVMNNVALKMGYFATSNGQVPITLEADIQDNTGAIISKTSTFAPGYGLFPFRAEPGKSYRLVITSDYGKGQFFPIPAHNPEKMAVMVTRPDKDYISALAVFSDEKPREVTVTVTEKFSLIWAATYEIAKSARIQIPTEDFEPGIQQLTFFDKEGNVLANRLVYTAPQENLHLSVKPERRGNQIAVTMETRNRNNLPADGNFTISVADQSRVNKNGHLWYDYQNFDAELKNPVLHIPGIAEKTGSMGTALDYALIANELKSFSWVNVLSSSRNIPDILAEKGISGKVTGKKGEPLPNIRINMLNTKYMQSYSATSDENGNFFLPGLNPVDLSHFSISATDDRGRGNYNVVPDPCFSDKIGREIQKTDSKYAALYVTEPVSAGYLADNPGLLAKAPQMVRQELPNPKKQRNESYKNLLQTSTSLLEVIKMMKPYTITNGQIVFHGTQNSIHHQSGALIVLDGQKMGTSADVLSMIPPGDVETVNISLDPMDIQKYTGFNSVGLIEITTKKGEFTNPSSGTSGINQTEELYRDQYRIPRNFAALNGQQPGGPGDLRTTLLWEPVIKPDSQGIITFTTTIPASKTNFVICVSGIDTEGNFGKNTVVIP